MLALDRGSLYFTTLSRRIMTCSTADCRKPTELSSGGTILAIDRTNIYWAVDEERMMALCPREGCGAGRTSRATPEAPVHGIASDGTDYFWTTDESLFKCATAGCTEPEQLARIERSNGIALDETNVYWTTVTGIVSKCAKAGCRKTPTTLATVRSGADIAVDATSVYWASPYSSELFSCRLEGCGGAPRQLAKSQAYAVALDDQNIYWTTLDSVMTCPKSDCSRPITLASGQTNPADIVVDATHVYWTDRADEGAIRRVPK